MKARLRRRPVETVRNRMVDLYARDLMRLDFLLDCPSIDNAARRPIDVRFRGKS